VQSTFVTLEDWGAVQKIALADVDVDHVGPYNKILLRSEWNLPFTRVRVDWSMTTNH
jgi:hypothetical protein